MDGRSDSGGTSDRRAALDFAASSPSFTTKASTGYAMFLQTERPKLLECEVKSATAYGRAPLA